LIVLMMTVFVAGAQTNCSLFTDSAHIKACMLYNYSDSLPQGSRASQRCLDSAIRICPDYAEAWHEISVPYLKRGDFMTWRKYLDHAVALKPQVYLEVRAWCRFKFLKDYAGALEDLERSDSLNDFSVGQSGDGTYNLYVVMAICERELGNYPNAFHYFALGIDSILSKKGNAFTGLYDYVNRAVTKLRIKDYEGALADINLQMKKFDRYAEAWYYQGVIYNATHHHQEAIKSFEKAKSLYQYDGYHFSDPYCEMPDEVYLFDIENAIHQLKGM
jgi:tetratricopeptide (TPR) repeat protein